MALFRRPVSASRSSDTPFGAALAVLSASLIVAAAVGLPLAWDGSWYLYRLLADGAPATPHGRLIDAILQMPVLAIGAVDHRPDLTAARFSFALTYAVVPTIALAACWSILRRRAPALLIWPALGIGLALLPGLANFTSEAMIAVEIAWPIFCAAVVGVPGRGAPVVGVLALALALSHPTGPAFLLVAAVVAWVTARARGDVGFPVAPVATILLALTGTVWFTATLDEYQTAAATAGPLHETFDLAVAGAPLIALVFVYVAAAAAHASRTALGDRGHLARLLTWLGAGAIAAAVAVFVFWSADSGRWLYASEFRVWAPFFSAPLFAFLWLERRRDPRREDRVRAGRAAVIVAAMLCASSVITLQSIGWNRLVTRLEMLMKDRLPAVCTDARSVPWIAGSPLDNWALPPLSRVIQERGSRSVVLTDGSCADGYYGPVIGKRLPPLEP
jgi:hypothetical protein